MKRQTITAGFFLCISAAVFAEKLQFHITTPYGEDLSGVEIRILEDSKTTKKTHADGLCTIWPETDKFQNIGVIVQKEGWTVVKPVLGNYFRVGYREKCKVIL